MRYGPGGLGQTRGPRTQTPGPGDQDEVRNPPEEEEVRADGVGMEISIYQGGGGRTTRVGGR